ncbi:LuxR C-terminal-related transcriptional regulator [Adhaeribacter rhizoryzae]|uniref:Response regulator transcription factor n=1 Tax=Adhaeribacter rhizoryzae TaxID=2607907 RepID=A0A5M6DPS3_9BACT|nr:response regulator transcription factor [Adhaeribacter rhizoryzae]KAA5548396.1 response regulator transcription factor [Adhaeribacter rhizoryzae]
MPRLAIVEDNLLLRKNLIQRLSGYPDLEIVLVCTHGKQFVEALPALPPDKMPEVVLMDVAMDVMNGIEATIIAKEKYPNLHILMLSVFDDDDRVFNAIQAGASGYLLKEETAAALVSAIQGAMEGKAYMSPPIAKKTLEFVRQSLMVAATRKAQIQDTPNLSKRELEILQMLSQGLTYQHISTCLYLSEYTVQTHVKNIYSKMHVSNKVDAIRKALENKWFEKSKNY